ncbi:MAG: DUF6502 family protein [Burkholderiaceae bacterium]
MDVESKLHRTLSAAITQVLRPLFRVLLRHNMSFGEFEELAKRTYIDVVIRDFGIPGKKPSISRASILSGMTRKEVQRLLAVPEAQLVVDREQYNRAARVLTAWTRDPDFLDTRGEPQPLDPQEGPINFAELVRRHSGDVPVRAVLDELLRVGAVRRRDDGMLDLVVRAYVPQRSAVDKLEILGADVSDLIETIDHNIEHGDADPRFQRKVMYRSVPVEALQSFKQLSGEQAQGLLERLDKWLSERSEPDSPDAPHRPRARAGLGIYYFEQPLETDAPKERRT